VLQILKGDDQTQSIPVIMLTGKDDDESRQKAAALRNDDYLVKPVELEELRSRIEKALAKKSRH
jgi:DNA-binding response OmpR family regulator